MSVSSSAEVSGEVNKEECPCTSQNRQHTLDAAESLAEPSADKIAENPDRVSSGKTAADLSATRATDIVSSGEKNIQNGAVKGTEETSVKSNTGQTNYKEDEKKGISPETPGAEDQRQRAQKKACSFFVRSGRCRYGQYCRFLHPAQSKSEESEYGSAVKPDVKTPLSSSEGKDSKTKQTCKFYARSGWCSYGYRCKFAHVRKEALPDKDSDVKSGSHQNQPTEGGIEEEDVLVSSTTKLSLDDGAEQEPDGRKRFKKTKTPKQKRCRFYDMGHCRSGKRCRFLHAEKNETVVDNEDNAHEDSKAPKQEDEGGWQPARKPVGPVTSRPLSELKEGDAAKMRETEITQLKKRFPGDKLVVSDDGDNPSYRFTIKPTDPDWPYDLNEFDVSAIFPLDYPVSPLQISLPEDQVLPTIILRHISDAAIEWLEARAATNKLSGRAELMMRPFLRWFDRSLMRLFTEGARKFKKEVYAKAAGFEFISYSAKGGEEELVDQEELDAPSHPKEEFINHEMDENREEAEGDEEDDDDDDDDEDEEEDAKEEEGMVIEGDTEIQSGDSTQAVAATSSSSPPPDQSPQTPSKYVSPTENRRGTEIRFPRMEMSEFAATLACEKIKIRIQCSRCKVQTDVGVAPGLAMVLGCSKCQSQQAVGYRPCIIHQFSSVMGFLDLTGCVPVDLIIFECKFLVSCLECSTNSIIQGIQYGQDRLAWCSKCHKKMSVAMDTARFQRLVASVPEGKTEVVAVKKDKRQKDPAIREGFPLPANGTCQHYKKSFRWLRFPCCGKCYPCDECHDVAELDHEMKFASRMVCGFCSKEQPYSADKPCQSCGSNVTKSRTTHWEGGTGCRNKTKMSRTDKQKFANLSKTTSRHAKKVEEFQKGKKKK
ncbi:uncharacterized protein LOC129262423 [Lytechinus pictus]|uniref:uncharacterized protein LOC129262423 n=1 Tax=Lytechinus pictus TaxID=7653 RepID=UPI0030B9E195